MLQNKYGYFLCCIIWGAVSRLIENGFDLYPASVCIGAGIPFFVIFKPWEYFSL